MSTKQLLHMQNGILKDMNFKKYVSGSFLTPPDLLNKLASEKMSFHIYNGTFKRLMSSVKNYFLLVVEGFQWLENLFMVTSHSTCHEDTWDTAVKPYILISPLKAGAQSTSYFGLIHPHFLGDKMNSKITAMWSIACHLND
jgi:hypothetical protein